jgi:hypothetical protein
MTPLVTNCAHWRRKTSLLAIDPGAHTGWALFLESGGWHLAACGVASPTSDMPWPGTKTLDQVVIEDPVIYPHSKARPADLMKLARIVGRYEERFAHARAIELVTPRSWKGSVDGDIMLKRIEAALTMADRTVYDLYSGGYKHNMTDAVGLGLWALKQPFILKAR